MSIWEFFKKDKLKRPLRDKKGRAYYLTDIPWYARNPRLFIYGGGMIVVSIVFSAPIYHFLFTKEEDVALESTMWKHERDVGIRSIDTLRAKIAGAGPNATLKEVFSSPPDFEKMPPPRY